MPIYEYECSKCGVFEVSQRITEPSLGKCPTCKRKVQRLISNTSFQLKGGGWYVTDYAKKGGSKSEGDGKKAEGGSSESKSDSKSESKSESTSKSESSSSSKSSETSSS